MEHRISESLGVETLAAIQAEPRVRFAQWHAAPPKPAMLSQRLQRTHWERVGPMGLCVVAMLFAFPVMTTRIHGPTGAFLGPFLAVPLILVAMFGFSVWLALVSRRAGHEVRDMMEFPSPEPQYPVSVGLHRNGTPYGSDIGVISFTDGVLHFQGRRCAFDLPRGNVRPTYENTVPMVHLSHGQFSGKIGPGPYDEIDKEHRGYRRAFHATFKDWMALPDCQPGDLVPPPLTSSSSVQRALRWVSILFYLVGALGIVTLVRDFQLSSDTHRIAQLMDVGHGVDAAGMVDPMLRIGLVAAIIPMILLVVAALFVVRHPRALRKMADEDPNTPT